MRKRSGKLGRRLAEHRRALFVEQQGLCFYCLRACQLPEQGMHLQPGPYYQPPNQATIEHLKPVAYGGTNHKINLVMACLECNWHATPSTRRRDLTSVVQMSSLKA